MSSPNTYTNWEEYCTEELSTLRPILKELGYSLNEHQPHLRGERFLMQAVTTASGKKLILLGTDNNGAKVVIKATRDKAGIQELEHEQTCRKLLQKIIFARSMFHTPKEISYLQTGGFVISIQEFIEQQCSFLERPIEEQFTLALDAFKAQESAHATTYKHRKLIEKTYSIRDAQKYIETFQGFQKDIKTTLPDNETLHIVLNTTYNLLRTNTNVIEQYGGFLTHTDFVPHNIRIKGDTIYLLDHSSLTFGNKYEGWARFLNFMVLYNQPLEHAFVQYVQDNRAQEEQTALQLMRVYRLGEIICYYANTLANSEGNLLELNTLRIDFWKNVLSYTLQNKPVPKEIISMYQTRRDSLRSDGEKTRQKGLH